MLGTTVFMRYGMWLIGIGYALDKSTNTQRDIGKVNKTFKVKQMGDSLYIERKIEHDNLQYALRYSIIVNSDSSLVIKELDTPIIITFWRWLKRNVGNIISFVKLVGGI